MKRNILIGMIRPIALFLAPDGAGGAGGSGSANPGQQQQQQQTDDDLDAPIDLGFDADLLDDESRVKYDAAQKKLQALQKELKEARSTKELVTRMDTELKQLRQHQQQGSQQQQQSQAEQTFEQEMVEAYKASGMTQEQAVAAAKINAPIFGMFAERITGHTASVTAPLAHQVQNQQMTGAFQDLQQDWRMAVPEIAEDVWQKSQNIAKNGGQVTLPVMQNLLKIAYVDFMDANPGYEFEGGQPQQQPAKQLQQQKAPMNGGTRFTFPGAGHMPRGPQTKQMDNSGLDPATAAALAQVKGQWQNWAPKQTKAVPVLRR